MINALEYTKKLEKAGFTKEQAEHSVLMVIEIMDKNFATAHDLEKSTLITTADIKEMRSEMQNMESSIRKDMKNMETSIRTDLNHGFENLESRMTIKLGSMLVISVAAMATLVKILLI